MSQVKGNLAADFKAGVTVFLVAIPLCLGIALASGVPILSGLIAGIIGGIVVGYFSGSAVSVSGPAAGLVTIVLAAIAELGSYEMVLTSLMLAGVIQVALGMLGAGIIAHYIPNSVVKGMLAAIGLILILKQLPHSVGYDAVHEGSLSFQQSEGGNTFSGVLGIFDNFHYGAVIIALISFFLLFILNKESVKKMKALTFLPASLLVIIVGAIINSCLTAFYPELALGSEHLVKLPNLIGENAGSMLSPDWSALKLVATYKYAFILAMIASIETLLCIEAADKLDPMKRVSPTNKELRAQGIGNVLSGLIGGLPVTSVIVRTSVNIENNAKTKASAIIHGVLLVVSILVARPLINKIPLASLACILIMVGYKLTNERLIRDMFKKGMDQFLPFAITIASILFTDLLTGVGIGLVTSIFFVLRNYYKVQNFTLEDIQGEKHLYRLKFPEYITFLGKASLEKVLSEIPKGSIVEFNFTQTKRVDFEVKDMFEDFKISAKDKEIKISQKGNEQNSLDLCFYDLRPSAEAEERLA